VAVFAGVVATLTVTTLGASFLPALGVTRIAPVRVLASEYRSSWRAKRRRHLFLPDESLEIAIDRKHFERTVAVAHLPGHRRRKAWMS
jgi:hypothetical protein